MPQFPAPRYFENQWPTIKMKSASEGQNEVGAPSMTLGIALLDLYEGFQEKSFQDCLYLTLFNLELTTTTAKSFFPWDSVCFENT